MPSSFVLLISCVFLMEFLINFINFMIIQRWKILIGLKLCIAKIDENQYIYICSNERGFFLEEISIQSFNRSFQKKIKK